jgi:DNA-binding FadR family transcriptional regulator
MNIAGETFMLRDRAKALGSIEKLPSRVVSLLYRDIETGALEPGARLPTEQQLAEQFGVSRNVIREAIAQLRADGLIDARQGVGAFVLSKEQRSAIRIDREDLKDLSKMQQLFELRCILETEAARLTASRGNESDLALIRQYLDRMMGEERWEDGSIEADLGFHREIARATGNGYIHSFISFICEHIRLSIRYARQTNPLHDLVTVNLAEHVRIYDALAARDERAAAKAMGDHIIGAAARVGVVLAKTEEPA